MNPTLFEIGLAILMVVVVVALIAWFQRSRTAASMRRMTAMMTSIGLDPDIARHGDPRTGATMKEMRRRCLKCPREDYCDRWLAGEIEGCNAFCPNAQPMNVLSESAARGG